WGVPHGAGHPRVQQPRHHQRRLRAAGGPGRGLRAQPQADCGHAHGNVLLGSGHALRMTHPCVHTHTHTHRHTQRHTPSYSASIHTHTHSCSAYTHTHTPLLCVQTHTLLLCIH